MSGRNCVVERENDRMGAGSVCRLALGGKVPSLVQERNYWDIAVRKITSGFRPNCSRRCIKLSELAIRNAYWSLNEDCVEIYYSDRPICRIPQGRYGVVVPATHQIPQIEYYANTLISSDSIRRLFKICDINIYILEDIKHGP
ncbi:hypothetical protein Tco_1570268 [Tanacetum coccineum]